MINSTTTTKSIKPPSEEVRIGPHRLPIRFSPSVETLDVLNNRQWICSYSGGKDSTALVSWIEWLRRCGLVACERPALVLSDTAVEYPFLHEISRLMMGALTKSGWLCKVVRPRIKERLYNRIFGIGNTPIHPGVRKGMRWCTRSTKIDPMKRFSKTLGPDILHLSGVRWGESDTRDGKLSAGGCSAGGECGLPEPGNGVYGPIITWKTCKVIEWLSGDCDHGDLIPDLLPIMRRLVDVYEVKSEKFVMFDMPPKITAMRFGCIGCPAITNEKITNSKQGRNNPKWIHLRRIHEIWQQLYLRRNRCSRMKDGEVSFGPLRMEARKRYFSELLDIQKQAGIKLVTKRDEAFIRKCWELKAYPRSWSEADELFDGEAAMNAEPLFEPTVEAVRQPALFGEDVQ